MLPQMVFAALMSLDAKTTQVQIGEKFEVNLFINTAQENINAFEGRIIFTKDILNLKDIRDGNTIVNFWVEEPKNQEGTIIFSGITPGGFNGKNGLIFSAIFEAKEVGIAKFEIKDARVLRNDGTGSAATLAVVPLDVVISEGASAEIPIITKVQDTEPPESFVPEVAKDETLFEGKWFVVFATQDKTSGLDHYELKENRQKFLTFFSRWRIAEGPYILQDQELRSYVFVKAVDKAGNERIMEINPQNPLGWYENYENWIIMILLGVVIAYVIRKFLWRR
ncbi:cohesin domain-containing protein [Patescibacteria group bacterium]|nr:cohesin domain-containing protein [Patescibacteria group bacterium]